MSAEMNIEAERAAFEKHYGPKDSFAWRNADGTYKVTSLQMAWEIWQAARRTAPVSAPIGQELPKWIDDHKGADPFMDDVIAYIESMQSQYAERIRQLERELAGRKTASIDTPEFKELMGNWGHAYWSESGDGDDDEFHWNALIAYIDGRTAGAAPEGWKLVPVEPTEEMVTDGFESWPDPFFSKTEDWEEYEQMTGCQKSAHRARLCWVAMLAAAPAVPDKGSSSASEDNKYDCPGDARFSDAAPTPMNSGKEEANGNGN